MLRHGLVLLNWSSLILDNFFKNVDVAMADLTQVLQKVKINMGERNVGMSNKPYVRWFFSRACALACL